MPPGASPTLWNADERYRETYLDPFPGYYLTADAGYIDEGGYVFVMARTDDIINVAGHRLSTGAIEEVLASHPDVAECAVIGVADELKGQLPLGLLVLKAGVERPQDGRRRRGRPARPRPDRARRVVQDRRRRRAAAEDPLGEDPARDDAPHRRRPGVLVPATIDGDPVLHDETTPALEGAGGAPAPAPPPDGPYDLLRWPTTSVSPSGSARSSRTRQA